MDKEQYQEIRKLLTEINFGIMWMTGMAMIWTGYFMISGIVKIVNDLMGR